MNFHDFIRDSEGWQTLTRELLFENAYLQVYRTETRTPSRPEEPRNCSAGAKC